MLTHENDLYIIPPSIPGDENFPVGQNTAVKPKPLTPLEHALYYASIGWPVFPVWSIQDGNCLCGRSDCHSPGKHPIGKLVPQGRNSATMTREIIKKWWGQYPQANIGIATGKESGLVVVDVDPRHGGNETKKKLERLGNFPYTVTSYTGGHGEHIFMAYPGTGKGIKSKNDWRPGIDIKADGGYIVAPLSNHISGESYSWKIPPDKNPVAKIPVWLMFILPQDEESSTPKVNLSRDDLLGPEEDWVAKGLRGVNCGKRNSTAIKLAGYFIGRGFSESQVLEMLRGWNLKNSEPLPDKELEQVVASAARMEACKRIREKAGQGNDQAEAEPHPNIDLPWEEQRQAALQGLGERLGLPIVDISVSAGHESLWEIVLDGNISVMLSSREMCSQKSFHDRVFAAALISPNPVPKARNGVGGWRSVLRTLATWATRIDAGPEATLRGEVQEFINHCLSGYHGLNCFVRGKQIPHHVDFFILKQKDGPALFMRLDPFCSLAKQEGHTISRSKIIGVLSSLGHVNQRLKWPGIDWMVWRLNMATIADGIRLIVYEKAMFDGDD